jgi:hypothetical protein
VVLGVPGRLSPRIFSTFSTTRMVGCQPNAPAACTPGEIPFTHFQRLSQPQGRKEPQKKSQVTRPGIDPGTVRLIAQRLNHYATPGPSYFYYYCIIFNINLQGSQVHTAVLIVLLHVEYSPSIRLHCMELSYQD